MLSASGTWENLAWEDRHKKYTDNMKTNHLAARAESYYLTDGLITEADTKK